MKQRRNIWIYPIIVLGFLLMSTSSCEDDESISDYASSVTGTYIGTVNMVGTGSSPCTSLLTKGSGELVNLQIEIGSENIPPLNGIKVSSSGGNYNLLYTDSEGSFTGKVEGNKLTWTLTDGSETFIYSGTK